MERNVSLRTCQFGYRANTFTSLETLVLKSNFIKNVWNDNEKNACFVDMSKVFERINYELLLEKNRDRAIPDYIIGFFWFGYISSETRFVLDYNRTVSGRSKTSYGVHQGGITTGFLFCLCIDELLTDISNQPNACYLNFTKAYADVNVVACPSDHGFRYLLNLFEFLIMEHHLAIGRIV